MKQYIGARYVPTFADPLTWDNSHSYEALMMVDYMGDTYTSRKPVPPGIAITNTDYWVMTGSFNSQLSAIRTEVESIQHGTNKKYIFIGDSYGAAQYWDYDTWSTIVPAKMGLTNGTDYWLRCASGAGFCPSTNFLGELQDLSSISNKDEITDIYVFGGINDNSYTKAQINTAIETFMTYAKANYPYAVVHIGHISQTNDAVGVYNMGLKTLSAYSRCADYGAVYVPLQDAIADFELLNSDGVHPNEAGQIALSEAIYDYIVGRSVFTRHRKKRTFAAPSGASLYPAANNTVDEWEENGIYHMKLDSNYVTVSYETAFTLSNSFVDLIVFEDSNKGVFPRASTIFSAPVRLKISGSWEDTPRNAIIQYDAANDKIQIALDFGSVANVEGIGITVFNLVSGTFGTNE